MRTRITALCLLCVVVMVIQGCGETVRGVSRDVQRMGRGIKTIFISN